MRPSASALLCSAFLLLASPSQAQDQSEDWDWASYFMLEEVLLRRSDDPSLSSALSLPQPKLILETSENGNSRVKGRVGVEISKKLLLDLQVESPKTSDETTLATLDGLSDSSTAELGLTWIRWHPDGYAKDMLSGLDSAQAKSFADYGSPSISPPAIEVLGPELYRSALDASRRALKGRIPLFLTARAKAGPNEFRFVDSSTLKPDKESHTSRELTAELGAYMEGTYASLNYRRARGFLAGPTKELCTPFGATDALECRKLTVGPPTEATSEAATFELRRLFRSVGFAARLTRDLDNEVTGIEVPIYFLQKMGSSEMELNGGIAVKWRSDTGDYSVSAFIGPALSTIFRMRAAD